ncbi:MAG: hypothetical protein PHC46_05055 [Clostridia bacterium]|nr:hypothetical protein [Clostridia bacterium]
MNKKILSTLLIVSIAITSLFAYSSPSVVLASTVEEIDYSFELQKLNADMTDWTNFDSDYTENVTLTTTEQSTNAFTVSSAANGNKASDITFTVTVTTGEFVDADNATIKTSLYPTIEDLADLATESNGTWSYDEEVSYASEIDGNFTSASKGVFTTTFVRGFHKIGAEIARFKLNYKDAEIDGKPIAAGSYKSTNTIEIKTN